MIADNFEKFFTWHHNEVGACLKHVSSEDVTALADMLWDTFQSGNSIYIAGNDGCATNSIHFASDLMSAAPVGAKGLRAIPLTGNVAALTGFSPAHSYECVFTRQLKCCLRAGDLFIALSCSGDSPSLISAVKYARASGASTFALLGSAGGELAASVDGAIQIPSADHGVVETLHLCLAHLVSQYLRGRLLPLS